MKKNGTRKNAEERGRNTNKNKLRVLAAGDLHGSLDVAKKLSSKARKEKVDLVVLAGDLHGYMGEGVGILEPFREAKQKVLFVPGNLDFDDELVDLGSGRNIHGYYVSYGEVGIAGIGSPNWKLSLGEEDFELIRRNFERMKHKKRILVSHLHAAGTRTEKMGMIPGGVGDYFVRKAVEEFRPDFLIGAHIHEAEGVEERIGRTRVVQVGRKGTILEI